MGRIRKTTKVHVLKSWVWDHFKKDKDNEDKVQCSRCAYAYVNHQKDGCTSAMKHHLVKKHGINKPERRSGEGETSATAKKSGIQPPVVWHKKSLAEWMCMLVIEDGISFNVIKKSRLRRQPSTTWALNPTTPPTPSGTLPSSIWTHARIR